MSNTLFVICRQPLPPREGGWNLTLGRIRVRELTDLPPSLRTAAGAARISAALAVETDGDPSELAAWVAIELSASSRGLVVAQAGWEPRVSHGQKPLKFSRAVDVERALQALLREHGEE